ncbi:UvrD-helicase domain-containing protein [Gimesia sp.]|uniref:UvrD-helicase domain-containing protein n=1 Tax=Gimesia sp. TaxID=2024833 RepID=UPI0025C27073|nr:UvrD-helicase domain-containing protein [Gimesia sp.]|tara:strand:- start:303 stop:3425 length:3123 start_codon:yes stop_codon:yes gene_type:complete
MTNILEVVRAGAGSGKTFDLCNTVAAAVADDLDPARILATTFTKKAAAELKGRVQAKLLEGNGHAYADRLELAAIGTVHGVAHHLIRRYSIEMGLSPRLEVFEEGGNRVLSDLLGGIPLERWEALSSSANRLGVIDLSARILGLLGVKRGNRISDDVFKAQMTRSAKRVCEILAPDGPSANESPINMLFDLADESLAAIEAITTDTQKNTAEAKQKLRSLRSGKGSLWGTYLDAGKIAAGKKSGADACLDELRLHAAEVRRNPALHADVKEFSRLLAEETIALDSQFVAYKTERGLVDFTDLETLLLELLNDETLAKRVSKDYDLVLVDEFQDTNPLQLAIFQGLRALVPRNRWVGDSRQAIYGFRDTDPRLVSEVWDRVPEKDRSTLPDNHRSQKGLVQLVGKLFSPHFDEDPTQNPKKPALSKGVERWLFDSKNNPDEACALGCGIAHLHAEGTAFGDIAILERGNARLKSLAKAFDELGIPYLIESPGLFSTREGELLLAGMRLVANRNDSLAAATVLHLLSDASKATPAWIVDRLKSLAEAPLDDETGRPLFELPWNSNTTIAPLETIDKHSLSPSLVVQQVIEALALPKHVHAWGNSARRCSNLDSAVRHARDYEALAFSGDGSATLNGLILYFEQLAAEEADLRFTPQGHDAVTLMTYHGAKGLEWPVVVLSGLDSDRDPDMWKPVVRSSTFDDDPLLNRELRSWIWPYGESKNFFTGKIDRKADKPLETAALSTLEGIDQGIRESDENLRLLYVGCTRAKQKLVFAHRHGKYKSLSKLSIADDLLDPTQGEGEHGIEGVDTTLVIRHLSHDAVDDFRIETDDHQTWFADNATIGVALSIPRFYSPSSAESMDENFTFECTSLTGESFFPGKVDESSFVMIGDAVHSYLASLPSLATADESIKTAVAERCLSAFSVTGIIPASVLVTSGDRFTAWGEAAYPGATWHAEVAVSGPRDGGGQWDGAIDLIFKLPTGELVVVDHKSSPIRRDSCETKAREYVGQLLAYEEILKGADATVVGKLIHFPLAGVVVSCND